MAGKRVQAQRRAEDGEKNENLDRWLLTYADMITLLMLFFIILWAISNVDVAKYKTIAQSLRTAFTGGNLVIVPSNKQAGSEGIEGSTTPIKAPTATVSQNKHLLFDQAQTFLQPLIQDKRVTLKSNERGLTISIVSDIGFASGSASLSPEAYPILRKVAELLAPIDNVVRVAGNTDNTPIDTPKFPSNWELSAARAISVVKTLVDYGVSPGRLSATAYGDTRPVATNKTAEGMAYNRRVDITVLYSNPFDTAANQITGQNAQQVALPAVK